MANGFPWCVAGAPIAAWARKVFPNRSEGDAVAALWDAILKTVRVTGDGNAEARWREHIALLTARKEKLNALRFKSLHYTNSLGTDLTIELPDDHLWAAGSSETPAGVGFVANLPTEEIFHFYLGDPVEMLQLSADGSGRVIRMGQDILHGEK